MDLGPAPRPAVVLCPPLAPDEAHPTWVTDLADSLRAAGIPTLVPGPAGAPRSGTIDPGDPRGERMAVAGWVADQAITISAAALDRPLLLAVHGSAARGLPALAMSQRAARHNVVGYVLVDAAPPQAGQVGQDWPDAPVLYVRSPRGDESGLRTARLRGWLTRQGDPAAALLAHLRTWPDPA